MKNFLWVVGSAISVVVISIFALFNQIQGNPYPNPSLTPGAAETLNVEDLTRRYNGKTYSEAHRGVSEVAKQKVYDAYGVEKPKKPGMYEMDHFWPVCAGGSNDPKNLWPQPLDIYHKGANWGYKQKDLLEKSICRKIAAGLISSKELRNIFEQWVTDWIKLYKDQDIDYLDRAGTLSGSDFSYDSWDSDERQ